MKEKTVKNKATLALLRSNIRQGTQDWALARKVSSPAPSLLPRGEGEGHVLKQTHRWTATTSARYLALTSGHEASGEGLVGTCAGLQSLQPAWPPGSLTRSPFLGYPLQQGPLWLSGLVGETWVLLFGPPSHLSWDDLDKVL